MFLEYLNRFIMMLVFVVAAPFVGGLLDGIDRKLSARMQGRKGPGIMQPFYDVAKLTQKRCWRSISSSC